ncbi:MAG: 4-(cytidine 5'-diphospho)-2-C-methyl-D-erythritol kinase [Nitrospinota bacterium]
MRRGSVKALSPAKINLILKIIGKRKDGYHNLATLFQMVDLCDVMTFQAEPSGKIRVVCSDKSIPQYKNLVYLSAKSLWRPGLPGVTIRVEKRIPSGAGLGGGSSNAATALSALNRLWKRQLSNNELRAIGAKLGADVPFFLYAPTAWATGIGDRLSHVPSGGRHYLLLVKPRLKVSTAHIYKLFDRQLTNRRRLDKISPRPKRVYLLNEMVGMLENDLEPVVERRHPVIGIIKRRLLAMGSLGAMVSGSGSTVFGLFKNKRGLQSAYLEISKGSWWCAAARTVHSMEQLRTRIK